jgi:hypothetical protein
MDASCRLEPSYGYMRCWRRPTKEPGLPYAVMGPPTWIEKMTGWRREREREVDLRTTKNEWSNTDSGIGAGGRLRHVYVFAIPLCATGTHKVGTAPFLPSWHVFVTARVSRANAPTFSYNREIIVCRFRGDARGSSVQRSTIHGSHAEDGIRYGYA